MRILLLSCVLGVALGFLLGCRKSFSGDGLVTDSGFWSYPRYAITFDSFNAASEAHRTLNFKALPSARMTFGLLVTDIGRSKDVVAALRSSEYEGVILHVEITREDGTLVADVRASVKDWQVSRSSQRVMLWHEKLRDVRFDRRSAYEISIDSSGISDSSEPFILRPVLEGGGNEMP
jgi:hypothetical protein